MKLPAIGIALILLVVIAATPAYPNTIRCGSNTVTVRASKGEVIDKCGEPLYSSYNVWTYIIGGRYRHFHFSGNFLIKIEDGERAR
jgi:hypothetical protein